MPGDTGNGFEDKMKRLVRRKLYRAAEQEGRRWLGDVRLRKDTDTEIVVLNHLAAVNLDQDEIAPAIELSRQALDLSELRGRREPVTFLAHLNLMTAWFYAGHLRDLTDRLQFLAPQLDDFGIRPFWRARFRLLEAGTRVELGDFAGGRRPAEEALALFQEFEARRYANLAAHIIGLTVAGAGHNAAAVAALSNIADEQRRNSEMHDLIFTVADLALLGAATQDWALCSEYAQAGVDLLWNEPSLLNYTELGRIMGAYAALAKALRRDRLAARCAVMSQLWLQARGRFQAAAQVRQLMNAGFVNAAGRVDDELANRLARLEYLLLLIRPSAEGLFLPPAQRLAAQTRSLGALLTDKAVNSSRMQYWALTRRIDRGRAAGRVRAERRQDWLAGLTLTEDAVVNVLDVYDQSFDHQVPYEQALRRLTLTGGQAERDKIVDRLAAFHR